MPYSALVLRMIFCYVEGTLPYGHFDFLTHLGNFSLIKFRVVPRHCGYRLSSLDWNYFRSGDQSVISCNQLYYWSPKIYINTPKINVFWAKHVLSFISLRYTSHFYIGPAGTMITVLFLHVPVQSERPLEKIADKAIRWPYLQSANHIYIYQQILSESTFLLRQKMRFLYMLIMFFSNIVKTFPESQHQWGRKGCLEIT